MPMQRELCATIAGQDHTVIAEVIEEGRWRVVVDGRERVVDAREIRPGTWSLLVDGRSWVVDLDERGGQVVALAGAAETPIDLQDARRKRLAEMAQREGLGAGGADVIKAPIAGKVVKLLVEVGAEVTAGQGLVVLEAMKMENEIKAPRDGVVKEIRAQAGASVEMRESLLTIE